MNVERHDRARFAAELRRKGTLLSDEAIADVCEAYLELVEDGTITLELHEQLLSTSRKEASDARNDVTELLRYVDDAKIVAQRLGRIQGEPLDEFLKRLEAEGLP